MVLKITNISLIVILFLAQFPTENNLTGRNYIALTSKFCKEYSDGLCDVHSFLNLEFGKDSVAVFETVKTACTSKELESKILQKPPKKKVKHYKWALLDNNKVLIKNYDKYPELTIQGNQLSEKNGVKFLILKKIDLNGRNYKALISAACAIGVDGNKGCSFLHFIHLNFDKYTVSVYETSEADCSNKPYTSTIHKEPKNHYWELISDSTILISSLNEHSKLTIKDSLLISNKGILFNEKK